MEIIVDTREKKDAFSFKGYGGVTVIDRKLDTGDYSMPMFENKITIDRKANSGELYINIGLDQKRFKKELERMALFDRAYFVCSFPESDLFIFPSNSGIPKYRWQYLRIPASYLRRRIKEIQEEYQSIRFIFCDNKYDAEEITYELLKEYYDKNNTN
jgi:hypothetical protein